MLHCLEVGSHPCSSTVWRGRGAQGHSFLCALTLGAQEKFRGDSFEALTNQQTKLFLLYFFVCVQSLLSRASHYDYLFPICEYSLISVIFQCREHECYNRPVRDSRLDKSEVSDLLSQGMWSICLRHDLRTCLQEEVFGRQTVVHHSSSTAFYPFGKIIIT